MARSAKKTNPGHIASAVQRISVEERERFSSILSFWHKLEFFIPFDLDQRIAEEDKYKVLFLHRRDLDHGSAELGMPTSKMMKRLRGFNFTSVCSTGRK